MNPNRAAPTIPPAKITIKAMNESTRVRINSHLSVLVSPSNHQDDVTFYFAIMFSIGQPDASENVTRPSERALLLIISDTTRAGAASAGCDENPLIRTKR